MNPLTVDECLQAAIMSWPSPDFYFMFGVGEMSGAKAKMDSNNASDPNRSEQERKYYFAYEDRYRRVYEQGVPFWSAFPQELKEELEGLEELLRFYHEHASHAGTCTRPATQVRPRLLEPGCGEAPLAPRVVSLGLDYVGVDLAPSALKKAKERLEVSLGDGSSPSPWFSKHGVTPVVSSGRCHDLDSRQSPVPVIGPSGSGCRPLGNAFLIQHDVTELTFFEPQSFDLAVDANLLHMLVVDSDRDRYLSGLSRVLKPGAHVLFMELFREDTDDGPVESFDEYMRIFAPDLVTVEERTAFKEGEEVKIQLTQVQSRPRSRRGYLEELGPSGFEVLAFTVLESGLECRIIARRL